MPSVISTVKTAVESAGLELLNYATKATYASTSDVFPITVRGGMPDIINYASSNSLYIVPEAQDMTEYDETGEATVTLSASRMDVNIGGAIETETEITNTEAIAVEAEITNTDPIATTTEITNTDPIPVETSGGGLVSVSGDIENASDSMASIQYTRVNNDGAVVIELENIAAGVTENISSFVNGTISIYSEHSFSGGESATISGDEDTATITGENFSLEIVAGGGK